MKIFNYRNWDSVVWGVVWFVGIGLFAVLLLWALATDPAAPGGILLASLILFVWLLYPVYIFLKFLNERITFEGGRLTRFGLTGRRAASIDSTGNKSLEYRFAPLAFRFWVRSGSSVIRFSSTLRDVGSLLETLGCAGNLDERRVYSQLEGEYRYKSENVWSLALITTFSVAVSSSWRHLDRTLTSLALISSLNIGAALIFNRVSSSRAKNEIILLVQGRLVWIDRFGRERVNVPISEITPGSMTWNSNRLVFYFRLETTQGPVRWSSKIHDPAGLSETMRSLCKQPNLPLPHQFQRLPYKYMTGNVFYRRQS